LFFQVCLSVFNTSQSPFISLMKHFSSYLWPSTSLVTLFFLLAARQPVRAQQPARAQPTEAAQQAAQLALQTSTQWAGSDIPAAAFRISSARIESSGLLYGYSQQLQAGIPVYNRVATLVFKNGKLSHHAGTFLPAKAFVGQPATPTVTAAAAVLTALASTPAPPIEQQLTTTSAASGVEQQQTFAPAGMAHRPIEARLVWATDKGMPRLAWNVNVELLATPDWLNIRVDATTGKVLGQDNWTVQEKASHLPTTPSHHAMASASPDRAPQALRQPSSAKRTMAVTPASYRVVPFPNERPDVTTPRLDTNPWLRAGAGNPVTSYGWHFDGVTNYTDTRGNNVWAYDDSLKQNAPGRFTPSTGTNGSLLFNDVPDFTQTPTLGRNRRAATTNLFYWNNLMHDVMYQYGFTEAAGNFQTDNQGRGGVGRDHVRAEAQDGGGTNNANFSTPPDGTNGRMQMYLFTGITPTYYINVTAPPTVAGNYVAIESGFSTNNKLATLGPISGQLALYADANSTPTTYLACGAYGGAAPLTGKIAVLYRGVCGFSDKVKNAQLAGAVAAIVINNAAGPPIVMGGTDNTVTIPAVMISQADGATLVAQIANGVQVTLPKPPVAGPQLDGDYDSGVMSHEYGHGISNRLTGGGVNTSCLGNAEQAGEGWSDFFGLMMTTDWAATQTADGAKARPVGTYVNGQALVGGGIRRYPYSTSLTVNPLTYASMAASTEVHNIGEIWCATVWDMTWNIIQQQGTIEPNLYNSASTGGNAVALNLVMQGLKLQPCEPGFLDSRDAILAADSLLYNGRYHCAIWSAFARRGMGYSAKEGSSNSATDQIAAYDLPGVRLSRNSAPIAGNQFAINITATCECQTQAPVSITDQLPTGLQYLSSTGGTLSGSTVTFANLSFTQGQKRTLQIVAQAAPGAGCTVALPVNDDRDGNTVGGFTPAVVTNGGGNAWAPTMTLAHSGTTAWGASDPSATSDVTLTSAAFTPGAFSVLSFYHFFNSEARYDGGLVAISVNNGAWQDAGAYFLQNGYNSVFDPGTASAGNPCFSGKSSGLTGPAAFQQSIVNLTSFSGQSIRVRFQFQSDSNNPYGNTLPGWYVDDIQVQSGCGGLQQVQLLNSAGTVTGSYAQATFLTEPVNLWTGIVSTDWFTAGNWSTGVPTSTVDVSIPAGAPRYPLLSAGTATVRSLALEAGATLTQTGGTLDVSGNWTNNGTFTATGGTVSLGQTIQGTTLGSSPSRFWNLTTQGSGLALNTSASASVQRVLTLAGNLTTNGNSLTLLSGSTGDALVVNNGGAVLGTATVQRYIDPSLNPGLGYRHYSAPVSNTTVADLATTTTGGNFAPVVNAAYNSAAAPASVTPFPTVYGYDDNRLTLANNLGGFDKGFVSPAALTDPLVVGRGYTVNLAASELVDFQGTLTTGDRSLSLTSSRATYPDGGWQLLGNPYPAPLDYSLVAAADRPGLESAIYVYSSTSQYQGRYRAYVNGIGNPVVPVGQGFFARVATGLSTATLTFRNSQRLTAPNGTAFQRTTADARPQVQLTLQGAGSPLLDEATVYFETGATPGFDLSYDAEKMTNPTGLNLSTNSAGGTQLSINGQPELSTSQRVVSLAVGVPTAGVYTFTASQLLNLSAVPVYLRDLQLGTLTDLSKQSAYQFTVSNASAMVTGRFELVFSPQQALATVPAALAQQVNVYPNPARNQVTIELPVSINRQPVTATLIDAVGRTVRQQVLPAGLAAHQLLLQNVVTGVYSLHLTTELGTVVRKLVVE
jgi:extracellular elastinolytic metalloproteinase